LRQPHTTQQVNILRVGAQAAKPSVKPKSDPFLKVKSLLRLHEIPCPSAKNNKAYKCKSFGTPRFGWKMRVYGWNYFPVFFPDIWAFQRRAKKSPRLGLF
jgi:hypothetical protein